MKLLAAVVLNSKFGAIKVLLLDFDTIPDMVLHLSDLFKQETTRVISKLSSPCPVLLSVGTTSPGLTL